MADPRPIGVFDSGVGGLSVLRALQVELPAERFVYVADNAYAPYGERDDDILRARAHAIGDYLIARHHIKALVVACNTATAAAIHTMRAAYPDLPIVGIEPALKPAAAASKTGVVGVMATRATLNSEKFNALLASLHGTATFVLQPCDGLADAIERSDHGRILALCQQYTAAMGRFGNACGEIDQLVLGCTHYPFVTTELMQCIGSGVSLVEGGVPVARQTHRVLDKLTALSAHQESAGVGSACFYSTGSTVVLDTAVQRWLGLVSQTQQVSLL